MSDLKFTCPSCAQHIQCDESYAGEKIPCPNCATLVRVPADAPLATAAQSTPAALPPTPTAGGTLAVPTLEENFLNENGTPAPSVPPLTAREQQIAAARAAHQAASTSAVKPRLSYILSGGQAPAPQENESAAHAEHKQADDPPHAKSLSE
ncbi:MAG TPA: hypothetical protein VHC44_01750 [Verrucomicrobiae bacterium]|nr:hypothetical protein [Verrucomicrobiae bacterium]